MSIAPVSSSAAVPLAAPPAAVQDSFMGKVAESIGVVEALLSATGDTLEKLKDGGGDTATLLQLQGQTNILETMTALTAQVLAVNKDNLKQLTQRL